jgi:hypothetical protein
MEKTDIEKIENAVNTDKTTQYDAYYELLEIVHKHLSSSQVTEKKSAEEILMPKIESVTYDVNEHFVHYKNEVLEAMHEYASQFKSNTEVTERSEGVTIVNLNEALKNGYKKEDYDSEDTYYPLWHIFKIFNTLKSRPTQEDKQWYHEGCFNNGCRLNCPGCPDKKISEVTDEEIYQESVKDNPQFKGISTHERIIFQRGAKWMRERMQSSKPTPQVSIWDVAKSYEEIKKWFFSTELIKTENNGDLFRADNTMRLLNKIESLLKTITPNKISMGEIEKKAEELHKKIIECFDIGTNGWYEGTKMSELISDFAKDISASDAGEWISVGDRLPDEGQYVLLYGKGNRQITSMFQKGKFLCYDLWHEGFEEAEEITHWKPLPNPPKNAGEKGEDTYCNCKYPDLGENNPTICATCHKEYINPFKFKST